MSSRYNITLRTALQNAKRTKEGRGTKLGTEYTPWLRISDVSSLGRRHREYSQKFGRVFHLLSDLELHALFVSEYRRDVVGNREQYPLPQSRTQEIAKRLQVKHPRPPGSKIDSVMTTDQVWDLQSDHGQLTQPVIVKYFADLKNDRVIEKLAIEFEAWNQPNTLPPMLFTEKSITPNFVLNWDLIRPTLRSDFFDSFPKDLVRVVNDQLAPKDLTSFLNLGALYRWIAKRTSLPTEVIIPAVHHLIATHKWPIDLDHTLLIQSRKIVLR